MPARKPAGLITRHMTVDERATRESAEGGMKPRTQLTVKPPDVLKEHKHAIATWKRLIGLYMEVEGMIVTAFDLDLLAKYCLLEDECLWLEGKRKEVDQNAARLNKMLAKMTPKDLGGEKFFDLLNQYNALNTRVQGLDARLDGKRKLLHALAQSLYLTPRSRAGVAPTEKPKDKPDEFGGEFDQ